eukprot:m51a1_g6651 putative cyclin p3 1 (441) ;mRNA; r:135914-138164
MGEKAQCDTVTGLNDVGPGTFQRVVNRAMIPMDLDQPGFRAFEGRGPPTISVADYISRIAYYVPQCCPSMWVTALLYIDRLLKKNKGLVLARNNVHRVIITSVMLALKFNEDKTYANKFFSRVAGIDLEELNNLELTFLRSLDWDLDVTASTFSQAVVSLRNLPEGSDALPKGATLSWDACQAILKANLLVKHKGLGPATAPPSGIPQTQPAASAPPAAAPSCCEALPAGAPAPCPCDARGYSKVPTEEPAAPQHQQQPLQQPPLYADIESQAPARRARPEYAGVETWRSFVGGTGSYGMPESNVEAKRRFVSNVARFGVNYAVSVASLTVLAMCFFKHSLVLLLVFWVVAILMHGRSMSLCGRPAPEGALVAVLGAVSAIVLAATVRGHWLDALGVLVVIAAAHAVLWTDGTPAPAPGGEPATAATPEPPRPHSGASCH